MTHPLYANNVTSGSTEGALPGSFRAESYGCLAVLRFVYHFRLFHGSDPILCRNTFFCDNEGLIKQLKFAQGPLRPFPWHYLRSDMDLELQILDTIQLLAITLTYTHVKGHQDFDEDDDDVPLTREALLNIECDHLATAALATAQPAPSVQFLPAGVVSVMVAGQIITRKSLAPFGRLSAAVASSPRSSADTNGQTPSPTPSPGLNFGHLH
jgi:hypothetical protein